MKAILKPEIIKFLIDSGLLFEINRCVLHPLGLALAIKIEENGNMEFDSIWDRREDPSSFTFTEEAFEDGKSKLDRYYKENAVMDRLQKRLKIHGFLMQRDRHPDIKESEIKV